MLKREPHVLTCVLSGFQCGFQGRICICYSAGRRMFVTRDSLACKLSEVLRHVDRASRHSEKVCFRGPKPLTTDHTCLGLNKVTWRGWTWTWTWGRATDQVGSHCRAGLSRGDHTCCLDDGWELGDNDFVLHNCSVKELQLTMVHPPATVYPAVINSIQGSYYPSSLGSPAFCKGTEQGLSLFAFHIHVVL